mgnify:CR=1 FL=1
MSAALMELTPATAQGRAWGVHAPSHAGGGEVPAEQLFGGEGVDGVLRDALYQWHEQRDLTINLFGPFDIEAVRYARRIAAPSEADAAERLAARRRGDCVDCLTVPRSAGRSRCIGCHRAYLDRSLRGNARPWSSITGAEG